MQYDILIKNGKVIDGSGLPGFFGDVGILDGRIVEVGRINGAAKRVLDADGLVFFSLALVYSVVSHGRWGRTLGKAALELEVVSVVNHQPPGYRFAAARFAAQWGLFYFAIGAKLITDALWMSNRALDIITSIAIMLAIMLLPLEGALASWLTPHKRTLWDRMSRTIVRYRRKS